MTRKAKAKENVESETFTCKTCSKAFSTQKGLRRHVMRNHRGTTFYCYYCDFTSKFKECIARHAPLHLVKKDVIRTQGAYVKCPLCEFGCVVRETMIKHYVDEHDVDIKEQNIEFPNMEEFLKWKYYIEQADVCQFTSRSKKNRDAAQIRYYRCFRDGIFQKKGRGIRNMKLKGSLKINGVCPAGMKAEEDRVSGVVRVTCIRSHVGHSNELGLLNLSKIERAEIAKKLAMGMTHEDIIGGIRGSMDAKIKRVHLTTRKDLWNVQSSYGLGKDKKKYVKHSKATKASEKDDQTTQGQSRLEDVRANESSVVEPSNTEGSVCNISVPNETETLPELRQQEHCTTDTSEMHVWDIQCPTEPQESVSFYSAQSVPEKTNTNQSFDIDNTKTMPLMQHGTEACETSSDNDDHYFEIVSPDLSDSRLVPLEIQLNEKKIKIRSKLDELMDIVKTDEQADILYNELIRIQDTILAHSSLSRLPPHFHNS